MEQLKVGGMSSIGGIEFETEKYESSIDLDENKVELSDNPLYFNNKMMKMIKRIPFVRGVFSLFYMFFRALVNLFKENKMWLFVISTSLIYILFGPHDHVTKVSHGFIWDNYIIIILYFLLCWFIFSVRKNHSIEHKIISAFYDRADLSLANIKKQPKENRRCGGVMASWMILLSFLIYLLIGDFSLWYNLLVISVGYELFELAQLKGIIGNIFYAPGYFIQKLTTSNNISDEDVLKARGAMIALLDKEGVAYTL